jgi:hypothetical protein
MNLIDCPGGPNRSFATIKFKRSSLKSKMLCIFLFVAIGTISVFELFPGISSLSKKQKSEAWKGSRACQYSHEMG